jgi:hypothetical protein
MEKVLSKELNILLQSSLDEIDPQLRVTLSMSVIIRAVDKEFSLSANYPKGNGILFLEWIREYHPSVLLLHVERAAESRQDLCTEGLMPIYMNYPFCVEFLDNQLRKYCQSNENTSILQQNLFAALTSLEMIALSRLLSILHISVCMPFRWLAGKTHELKDYDWGLMLMSPIIDILYNKMKTICQKPDLIEDDSFMMNIFEEYLEELQPNKEYWSLMFEKKRMSVVVRSSKDGSKVVHMERLRAELFSPTRPTNVKTKEFVVGLANTAAKAICDKLVDESKATYKYTSMSKSDHSYKHCSEERKRALLGQRATNDEAKSALGSATANIQRYGSINISSAGAMSDANQNKFLQ